MTYAKTTWVNEPIGGTPISAAALNKMEAGIGGAIQRWTAATSYLINEQVISPNNDVVSAIAAFISGVSYDPINWNLNSTFGRTTTVGRPAASDAGVAAQRYDTTLGIPIWSNGTVWKNAAGTAV